jgi:hypothetical protein
MRRNTCTRITFALLVTLALIDLHLYRYRFHPSTEMLGQYLRQQIDQPRCGQLIATGMPRKCVHRAAQQRDAEAPACAFRLISR